MEKLHAALLLHKAGKQITEESLTAVLKSAGANVDSTQVKAPVAALKDVNIDEVIKNTSLATSVAAPAESKAGKAEVVEEKKDDKASEEEAAAGLGALFG